MQQAEYQKMEQFTEQVKNIHLSKNKVKFLATALQNLEEGKHAEVLNNWENRTIEEDYVFL